MTYDLVIAYRIYPGISKNPVVCKNSKYDLAKLCIDSLSRSLSGIHYKVYALMDNCPKEFDQLFTDAFGEERVEFVRYNGIGNFATFAEQIRILSTQTESEYVYFAEDDYFYLDGQFHLMLECLKNKPNVDFLTVYGYTDSYYPFHNSNYNEFEYAGKLWKRTSSSCLTFLTTKTQLNAVKYCFKTFSKWSGDGSLWSGITLGWSYFGLLKNFFKLTKVQRRVFVQMSLFFLPRFILNRKKNLYMATPSIGTHMETGILAQGVDWNKEINRYLESPVQICEEVHNMPNKITTLKKIKNIIKALDIIKHPLTIIPLVWIICCLLVIVLLVVMLIK